MGCAGSAPQVPKNAEMIMTTLIQVAPGVALFLTVAMMTRVVQLNSFYQSPSAARAAQSADLQWPSLCSPYPP